MDNSSKSIAHGMTVLLSIAALLLAAGEVKHIKNKTQYFMDE